MPFSDYDQQSPRWRDGRRLVYHARARRTSLLVQFELLPGAWSGLREVDHAVYQEVALLSHPNVLAVLEAGRYGDGLYLVRPDFGGEFLEQALGRGPVGPERAARWVAQLARGVQHAHDHGIFPREVTPRDVQVGADGTPRLSDFANAHVRFLWPPAGPPAGPVEGPIVGTPAFLAPEAIEGKGPGYAPPGAVWGLGVLLYMLLTGQRPFQGASPIDTLMAVLHEPAPSPRGTRPDVDPALEAVCLRCLRKKPEARCATPGQVADQLERYLAGEPVETPARPPAGWLRRWLGRSRG
jgi:serine/threonine-protein kinase